MPVIIEDVQTTTGASVTLKVPVGRHDRMILLFAIAWDIGTGASALRMNPSGGGGTWENLGYRYWNEQFGDLPSDYVDMKTYCQYSYPTSTGNVSIDCGGFSGEGRYTAVLSLSNAKFANMFGANEAFSEVVGGTSTLHWQGSRIFGSGIAGLDSIGGVAPYNDATLVATTVNDTVGTGYLYTAVYEKRHSGYYTNQYRERGGVDWNTPAYCAYMQIAVDSVECAHG